MNLHAHQSVDVPVGVLGTLRVVVVAQRVGSGLEANIQTRSHMEVYESAYTASEAHLRVIPQIVQESHVAARGESMSGTHVSVHLICLVIVPCDVGTQSGQQTYVHQTLLVTANPVGQVQGSIESGRYVVPLPVVLAGGQVRASLALPAVHGQTETPDGSKLISASKLYIRSEQLTKLHLAHVILGAALCLHIPVCIEGVLSCCRCLRGCIEASGGKQASIYYSFQFHTLSCFLRFIP